MSKNNNFEDLIILRDIHKNPNNSQRILSKKMGLSLGKLNYCLKALRDKGLVKFRNFNKNKNKRKYIYVLTPKGIMHKSNLAIKFMRLKMQEYEDLKNDIDNKNN